VPARRPVKPRGDLAWGRLCSGDANGDHALVTRIRCGDEGAFHELYARYQRRILHLAFSLVGNEHDAEEVVQDALLRVHLGLDGFRGTSSFYTWLHRIVVNVAIDVKRRPFQQRVSWESIAENVEDTRALALPRVQDSDPYEALDRVELARSLVSALCQLPVHHRVVILMREIEGMSYQEMAQELNISRGTIMSRLHHARRRMQRSLANYR
jgi:RNA polymerase sigma-70 factor (ECF subfamily)